MMMMGAFRRPPHTRYQQRQPVCLLYTTTTRQHPRLGAGLGLFLGYASSAPPDSILSSAADADGGDDDFIIIATSARDTAHLHLVVEPSPSAGRVRLG